MDKKSILMREINKLLEGRLTYEEFKNNFWSFYLKKSSSSNFNVKDDDFFAEIQETFDWTVENPTDEERKRGYLDWQQFIKFVKKAKEVFLKKGKLDFMEAEQIRQYVKINQ